MLPGKVCSLLPASTSSSNSGKLSNILEQKKVVTLIISEQLPKEIDELLIIYYLERHRNYEYLEAKSVVVVVSLLHVKRIVTGLKK